MGEIVAQPTTQFFIAVLRLNVVCTLLSPP